MIQSPNVMASIPPPPPSPPPLSNNLIPKSTNNSQVSLTNISANEPQIVEEYTRIFVESCRIQPKTEIQGYDFDHGDMELQEFHSNKEWDKILAYVSSTHTSSTLDVYFKELLDYSTLNKTFCYYLESLFHTNHFDEILSLTSTMLNALDKAQGEGIADPNDQLNKNYSLTECWIILKLITYEVKVMTGLGNEAIEDLHTLEQLLLSSAITSPDYANSVSTSSCKLQQWCYVVLMTKINVCIRQRHLDTAIRELIKIIKLCAAPSGTFNEIGGAKVSNAETEIVLLCHLTRLCIQEGAVKAGENYYRQALSKFESSPLQNKVKSTEFIMSYSVADEIWDLLLVTRGLVHFAVSEYEEAMSTFSSLVDRYKQHHMLFSADPLGSSSSSSDASNSATYTYASTTTRSKKKIDASRTATAANSNPIFLFYALTDFSDMILPLAVNNMTVCALFLKQMSFATLSLENVIKLNPYEYFTPYTVFNLCTLYDLSLTPEQSSLKKKALHKISLLYEISDTVVPFRTFRLS